MCEHSRPPPLGVTRRATAPVGDGDPHAPRLTRITQCCAISHTFESVSSLGSNPDMAIEHSMSTSYPVSACEDGS